MFSPIRLSSFSLFQNPNSNTLMDSYYEQRLRDEVIYLHSLRHHRLPENPNLNPNSAYNPSRHLQLSNPTRFKKEKTRAKPRGIRGNKGNKRLPESDPPQVSDVEWPCEKPVETPSLSASGWPTLRLPSVPPTRFPSAEERARFTATQVQQKGLKAAQVFFAGSDGDDEDGGSDEDDFMDEDEYEECKFFSKVFTEDAELMSHYEKNCGGGDFCCLVCGGIGKKVGKSFKDCVALIQHSITIAKTKKKRAHRAYAQVVCKFLGWDIDKLPTIVLSLGKSVEQGSDEVAMDHLNMKNQNSGSENVENGELILKEVSNVDQEEEGHYSSVPSMSNDFGDNVLLSESSSKVGDGNECMENLDSGNLSVVDRKTEGVVNCLCRNLSRTMVLNME